MDKSIPKDIKKNVLQIMESYNEENRTSFEMTFQGAFAYLIKLEDQPMAHIFRQMIIQKTGTPPIQGDMKIETKIGRLKYNGQMDNWDFSLFSYSEESYDSGESNFPGLEELDGTIEGTLKASQEFYA